MKAHLTLNQPKQKSKKNKRRTIGSDRQTSAEEPVGSVNIILGNPPLS